MKHPDLFVRYTRRLWHGLRLIPRALRLRRQKRTAAPPPPKSPYRRFYTQDRSFAQLVPRRGRRR